MMKQHGEQFPHGMNTNLIHEIGKMVFDRFFADDAFLGNFAIRKTMDNG